MTIHKEGYNSIGIVFIFLLLINFTLYYFLSEYFIIPVLLSSISVIFLFIVVQFFRFPNRKLQNNTQKIFSPCDGEVVVIEETHESEYFNDKRIQISIFMSPFNVHANWYPVAGKIKYYKYHDGKFLVAWHPKSSTENERSTIVVETQDGKEVLIRQIAGAVARRIVSYSEQDATVKQNEQLGFIKFGSRVDIFLPIGTKIDAVLNQKVTGSQSIIASFN